MKALSFYDLSEERQKTALEAVKEYIKNQAPDGEINPDDILASAKEAVYCMPGAMIVWGDWVKR